MTVRARQVLSPYPSLHFLKELIMDKLLLPKVEHANQLAPEDRTWSLSNPTTKIVAQEDPLGTGQPGWGIKILYASKGTHGGKAVKRAQDCKIGLVHMHTFESKEAAQATIDNIMSKDPKNPKAGFGKIRANNKLYWHKVQLDPKGDKNPRPMLWFKGKWEEIEPATSPVANALPF